MIFGLIFSAYSQNDIVYLKDIDSAKGLLLGKQLYILTEKWLKEVENGQIQNVSLKKYIPVTITKIDTGLQEGSVKMVFEIEDGKEYYLRVRFSGIDSKKSVSGIELVDVFSFDNPKNMYPEINDEKWCLIQDSKVITGMTKTEAKLSWGKPKKINSGSYTEVVQWTYDGGSYINFKNGKVLSVRSFGNDDIQFHESSELDFKSQITKAKVGDVIDLENIYFQSGESVLLKESYGQLDILEDYLKSKIDVKIGIEGHTDNTGELQLNQKLSEQRAKAIFNYLIQKGISKNRLKTIGYGETHPIASNNTEHGKELNRRVVIKIISK